MDLGTREEQQAKMKEMAELAEIITGKECNKCFGRGYEGWSEEFKQYIPCICVVKAGNQARMAKFRNREIIEEQKN